MASVSRGLLSQWRAQLACLCMSVVQRGCPEVVRGAKCYYGESVWWDEGGGVLLSMLSAMGP